MSSPSRSPSSAERLFPGDRAVAYAILVVCAAATVIPLLYMLSLSVQSNADIFSGDPVLWPKVLHFENYVTLFHKAPVGRFLLNSFIMAGVITVAHLVIDPLAGYAFAKFDFPLKRTIFLIVLSTLMVPFFVRMIPVYVMFSQLGWTNSYQGLIVPFLSDAFGIFLMRQFIEPLPDALIDAARVDGASELRIYSRIILPQAKPALAVLGLFTFIFQWNNFLWPLIISSSTSMRTLPVGLTLFNQEYFTQWNLTSAGSVVLFVPTAVLFFVAQRYLVRGISLTGLK